MLRYAITSGSYNRGDAARWATDGIDFIQLREKVMNTAGLIDLARSILEEIASVPGSRTRLLINGRADVAVAAGADGVHLTSHPNELTPEEVRRVFAQSAVREPVISISCHTLDEVQRAHDARVALILFGPVFEKRIANKHIRDGSGLKALRGRVPCSVYNTGSRARRRQVGEHRRLLVRRSRRHRSHPPLRLTS
jgi:thiamine-phosphate pyrophosphorylase